ncbi:MAG: hypothetical protein HY617_00500 [Candidatus Sungbacteria bacterium]|nr:hypothetical protein [Candidatus Sungbacteria bacterium]
MDILGAYEKNKPQTSVGQVPYAGTASSDGFLVRMVLKFSGGRVRDQKQALLVLLVIAGVGLLIAGILIVRSSGPTQHPIVNAPPPETIGQQNQFGQ